MTDCEHNWVPLNVHQVALEVSDDPQKLVDGIDGMTRCTRCGSIEILNAAGTWTFNEKTGESRLKRHGHRDN